MSPTETVKKRLEALSYQHSFSKCGDIEVMTCNDTAKFKQNDKDVVKVEDAIKVFKEFLEQKRRNIPQIYTDNSLTKRATLRSYIKKELLEELTV